MPHIIIILDGEPVVVDHPKGDDGSGGGRMASSVEPLTDWHFDHLPEQVQIFESDPERMGKVLKFCEKLCKE